MKIVGRVKSKYLVECDLAEIAIMAGYSGLYDDAWRKMLDKAGIKQAYGEPNKPSELEGYSFSVEGLHRKLSAIRQKEIECRKASQTLRDLAGAIDMAWSELIKPVEGATENEKGNLS